MTASSLLFSSSLFLSSPPSSVPLSGGEEVAKRKVGRKGGRDRIMMKGRMGQYSGARKEVKDIFIPGNFTSKSYFTKMTGNRPFLHENKTFFSKNVGGVFYKMCSRFPIFSICESKHNPIDSGSESRLTALLLAVCPDIMVLRMN